MKKVLIASLIVMLAAACTKETVPAQEKKETKIFVQAVAVDNDGTLSYSPVMMVK